MGVRTDADDELDRAEAGLKAAVESLTRLAVTGCWGSEDYHAAARAKHRNALRLATDALFALRGEDGGAPCPT